MNLLKNKMVLLSPIIIFAVIFLFSLILIPSVSLEPKNLPIAIVNEDQGVDVPNQGNLNMGNMLVDNIQKTPSPTTTDEPAVDWILVSSYEEVLEGLNNQEYYGALVIPKDYSLKQASFKTPNPSSPEIDILVNQGMSVSASNMAGQILNGVVDNINNMIRADLLKQFENQGGTLTTKQAAILVSPITKKVTNVNEIGTNSANGNAPVIFLQPFWMASFAGVAILYSLRNKYSLVTRTEKYISRLMEVLVGVVLAFVAGFGVTLLAKGMLGLHIPQFTDTALFLSITYLCFFLMILATVSWTGLRQGIIIYVIILFFGAPLMSIPPEFMSSFYRWLYSWLPMRFMVEGLRELFYFGKGISWSAISALVGIGLVSIVVLFASVLKPASKKEVKSQTV